MPNIWLLTEECPKISTVMSILSHFSHDFRHHIININDPQIVPLYNPDGTFAFVYELLGVNISRVFSAVLLADPVSAIICYFIKMKCRTKMDTIRH